MFRVNETKCMFSSKEILRILDCKACEVKDFEITEVSVDSRSVNKPESTLFFALKGINHDGHDYVEKLYEQGVRNFVVTELRADFLPLSGANFFVVDEVLPALQQLAAWYRGQMKAELVGITGSNGKTIVKEWLYQLLSDEPGIYRSPRSYNSQVGVPLSLLGMDVSTRLAIIEAGISLPGEMGKLQAMIRPEIGIFTHLGDAHGENFESRQQKLAEKAILFRDCRCIIGDTHLKVTGEVVTSLQVIFLIDWYFVRQELLLDKNEYLPYHQADNNVIVQTVTSGPDSDWASIQQSYFTLINMAKRYVFISTPYFMPGETTLNSLKTAAMSGVDVRLLLPHKSDSWLTHWCTRSYVEELLEAGVKIYWYQKGINHSKVIIVDGSVASVGTANMDLRSFEQNFEVSLIIYDREVVKKLAVDFMKDLKVSTEGAIQRWKFRTKREKVCESVARLFAPVL